MDREASEQAYVRIGQMADLHLGCRGYGIFERAEDFYESAKNAANLLISEKPDIVLVPGDIFDRKQPYSCIRHKGKP